MLRTTQNLVVAQPNQAPARSRSDLAGRLVRLNGHVDQLLAIGMVALQAHGRQLFVGARQARPVAAPTKPPLVLLRERHTSTTR